LFRTFILEYYATLAEAQGKYSAPFFCEKSDVHDAVVQGARLFFEPVKDIVIVRDPRDLLSSTIAFWKLRPETAMTILTTTIPRLARIARHAGPDSVVIRYEDLVRDPVNTRLRLSDFLDLDLRWRADADAIPDSHRTSPDPAASIGRWRQDLTKQQVDACEAAFGLYMREFDYSPARSGKSRREKANKPLVVAEGATAIAAFETNTVAETEDGSPSLRLLELSFGRQGNGDVCLQHGWSFPERGFVWSCAPESTVLLPAIRRSGGHRLHITLMPFTHAVALPVQRVTVLLDGRKIGTARLSDIGVLSIAVPDQVPGSDQVVTLTLCFPDAARPAEVFGGDDRRLLGCSLHRIALSRIETESGAAAQAETPERGAGRLVGRMVETFRQALRHPDIQYDATTLIRNIQGFDTAGFVRLILALESEFGVVLHEDEVDSINTMGDVFAILRAKPTDGG
jgi:acyl carrier protein